MTQVITREWVQPVDATHKVYRAASAVEDAAGNTLVTAYPVERFDGLWSVMLSDQDADADHAVTVAFADAPGHTRSSLARWTAWFRSRRDTFGIPIPRRPSLPQPAGRGGGRGGLWRTRRAKRPSDPDGPASKSDSQLPPAPGTEYDFPKASLSCCVVSSPTERPPQRIHERRPHAPQRRNNRRALLLRPWPLESPSPSFPVTCWGGLPDVVPSEKITLAYIGGTQGTRELLRIIATPEVHIVAV